DLQRQVRRHRRRLWRSARRYHRAAAREIRDEGRGNLPQRLDEGHARVLVHQIEQRSNGATEQRSNEQGNYLLPASLFRSSVDFAVSEKRRPFAPPVPPARQVTSAG